MADQLINSLVSSSITDISLGLVGDPNTGQLGQTSFHAMKDYFQQGVSINTGSLVSSGSFNAYTSSLNTQVANVFASESNYTLTSVHNALSSSYSGDSGSFNSRIISLSGSIGSLTGSYVTTGSFNSFTSSYFVDSSSFNTRIASITGSGGGVTGSFVSTASYNIDSSSFNSHIANVFASESNYLPTSSFVNIGTISGSGVTNFIPIFSGSTFLSSSNISQTATAVIISSSTTVVPQLRLSNTASSINTSDATAILTLQASNNNTYTIISNNDNNANFNNFRIYKEKVGSLLVGANQKIYEFELQTGVAYQGARSSAINNGSTYNYVQFYWQTISPSSGGGAVERMTLDENGRLGLTQASPKAYLHLPMPTSQSGFSPLKFTSGTMLLAPESGSMEFDGNNFYGTTGSIRQTFLTAVTASAPGNTTTPVIWMAVNYSGSSYRIPLYQ